MSNPLIESMREAEVIDSVSIALPTLGRFYDDGILDPNADPADIEVRAVGIMAEMHARDPFLLAAGKGVSALVLQICPSVVKPELLSEVDIEALLIASRIVSHGPEMTIGHVCENPKLDDKNEPVCRQEDQVKLNLQEFIMRYEPINIDDRFIVDLPEVNQRVHLRPTEYGSAMDTIKKTMFNMKDYERFEEMKVDEFFENDTVIEDYMSLVNKASFTNINAITDGIHCVEYNGGKNYDANTIKEWLVSIHRDLVKRISKKQISLSETLRENTKISYVCSKCGHQNETYLELDPQKIFFSEVEPSSPPKTPSTTSKRKGIKKTTPSRTSQR